MIIGALLAFEVFNFSTTQFALHDMLGDLTFAGIKWATILAIAFCGIDFAGIARIFTPEQGRDEPAEVYYLFGAWLLAAGFNATLTWWGVSVAISNNGSLQGSQVMSSETLLKVVPIFIALMVWSYRKDIQVNRIHFAKSYKILLVLLGFVLLLYLVVKLRKYL